MLKYSYNEPFIIPMYITKEILFALTRAIEEAGSQLEFARITGIKQNSLSRYLSGGTEFIKKKTWLKLEPYLRKYLSEEKKLIISESTTRGTILNDPKLNAESKRKLIRLLTELELDQKLGTEFSSKKLQNSKSWSCKYMKINNLQTLNRGFNSPRLHHLLASNILKKPP